jgi:heterodisulfide reductase subunit B
MKYSYYPGCSVGKNALSYHESATQVAKIFDLHFAELDDWNCCGASEYFSLNKLGAYTLVARNLAIAKSTPCNGHQLVAPCSMCFLNLSKTEVYLQESPDLEKKVNLALAAGGMHWSPDELKVKHLLEVFVRDLGYETVEAKVVKPLKGLKVAPYYGCLIVRPAYQGAFDDPEHPTTLDKLMKVLGATAVDFPVKASCCGGHMTQISESIAMDMLHRILKNAADYEADIIVTLCPMCQLNLEAYQDTVNKYYKTDYHIPVLYFTQLMGLALGIPPEKLGIGKELVDARPALAKIGVEVPPEEPARKKRPSKEELPMPRMPEKE